MEPLWLPILQIVCALGGLVVAFSMIIAGYMIGKVLEKPFITGGMCVLALGYISLTLLGDLVFASTMAEVKNLTIAGYVNLMAGLFCMFLAITCNLSSKFTFDNMNVDTIFSHTNPDNRPKSYSSQSDFEIAMLMDSHVRSLREELSRANDKRNRSIKKSLVRLRLLLTTRKQLLECELAYVELAKELEFYRSASLKARLKK